MNPMDFGDKEYNYGEGYPTPFLLPDETVCRRFEIPASDDNGEWLAIFMGLMMWLTEPKHWQQFEGSLSQDDAAAAWQAMIDTAYAEAEDGCPEGCDIETPFWDDASDVEDSDPADTQPWYGTVSDPDAPPDELDFVENAAVWGFTGLVALATPELGFAPAILFNTVARKFLIAQKAGDVGEIIRIVIDGKDAASIDTTGHSGEVMTVPIVGDSSLDTHTLYLIGKPA